MYKCLTCYVLLIVTDRLDVWEKLSLKGGNPPQIYMYSSFYTLNEKISSNVLWFECIFMRSKTIFTHGFSRFRSSYVFPTWSTTNYFAHFFQFFMVLPFWHKWYKKPQCQRVGLLISCPSLWEGCVFYLFFS